MRDKAAALKRAADALSQLGIPGILPGLRDNGVRIGRTTLGGSHSVVTYPPLDALSAVDPEGPGIAVRFGPSVNLYVHIAFCETMCSFCHYDVSIYRGDQTDTSRHQKVQRYLDALGRELELRAEELHQTGTKVSSVYVGGGTPLVLSEAELAWVFERIFTLFSLLPDAPICVEGSPLTVTEKDGLAKLDSLRHMGVTRFSFGVQSFNDGVLKKAARAYTRETAIEACALVRSTFDDWNVDLIQSLVTGTPDEVWDNLEVLRELKPPHITYYHGRFAKGRPQEKWLRDGGHGEFEGEYETLLGRMLIWQQLAEFGYQQVDGNRFVLSSGFVDPFKKARTSVTSDLLGVGSSAYSHVDMRKLRNDPPGMFFRNVVGSSEYCSRIEEGKSPVGSALALTPEEFLAASYVTGLRTTRVDSFYDDFARRSNPGVWEHYDILERRFLDLGLIIPRLTHGELGPAIGLELTPLGRLFEDEVLSSFYSPSVTKLLHQ